MASVGGGVIINDCLCCRRLFDKSQGKTGQGVSAANFLPAKKRQYKKEAVSAHGVGGQSNTLGTWTRTPRQVMHWNAPWTPPTMQP
jgi:hypothetical protein